jgi:sulfur carrier protein
MKIILNDRFEEFEKEPISVSELIKVKKFSFRMRIVKINGVFIPKKDYDNALIRNGDDVKMLYLMSGG